MIRVTVMVWFELENGEPRFKTWDDHMHSCDAQYVATQLAIRYRNGSWSYEISKFVKLSIKLELLDIIEVEL